MGENSELTPAPHLQVDAIHNQVNKPESDPNTGRTNSTTKYRKEPASERLGRSERQREAAHRREGAA